MFERRAVLSLIFGIVAMLSCASAGEQFLLNGIGGEAVVHLQKSQGGGWELLVIPNDQYESLEKSGFAGLYQVTAVSEEYIELRSMIATPSGFGRRKTSKRIQRAAITEITRFLDVEEGEK